MKYLRFDLVKQEIELENEYLNRKPDTKKQEIMIRALEEC